MTPADRLRMTRALRGGALLLLAANALQLWNDRATWGILLQSSWTHLVIVFLTLGATAVHLFLMARVARAPARATRKIGQAIAALAVLPLIAVHVFFAYMQWDSASPGIMGGMELLFWQLSWTLPVFAVGWVAAVGAWIWLDRADGAAASLLLAGALIAIEPFAGAAYRDRQIDVTMAMPASTAQGANIFEQMRRSQIAAAAPTAQTTRNGLGLIILAGLAIAAGMERNPVHRRRLLALGLAVHYLERLLVWPFDLRMFASGGLIISFSEYLAFGLVVWWIDPVKRLGGEVEFPALMSSSSTMHGQEHVLAQADALEPEARARLLADLEAIDVDQLAVLRARVTEEAPPPGNFAPAPVTTLPLSDEDLGARIERGEAALRHGRVACLTVAGGQGTRLGIDGPKGAVGIGPVSGRCLFDLFAARIAATQSRYGVTLPWLVMTGPGNDAQTRQLFADREHFGLDAEQIHFFCQGTLPALDDQGRLILAGPDRLFRNPDGHGGTVAALASSGLLDLLKRQGISLLCYFQVDNPLARVACPVMLGEHLMAGAEMTTKVVRKTDPAEKVGILGTVDGRDAIIEYSDLDDEARNARESDGSLRFWAGNIAIHIFDLALLRRVSGDDLPLHRAVKAIERWTPEGTARIDGIKFERFIFDLLGPAKQTAALEVLREREFAPVKNATGVDSLPVAQRMLTDEWRRWLGEAGIDARDRTVEIDPRFALDARALAERADEARERLAGGQGPVHLT